MTVVNGWLDWAATEQGPSERQYDTPNQGIGIVWHSMEGWYAGSVGEMTNPNRRVSWMFSLRQDGTLVQHYPVTASTWSSGSYEANTRYWAVELEGTSTMPINREQVATAYRLIKEWEAHTGMQARRPGNMVLHREVATLWEPNAGPTACPSERYNPLWLLLEQRDMPAQPDAYDEVFNAAFQTRFKVMTAAARLMEEAGRLLAAAVNPDLAVVEEEARRLA